MALTSDQLTFILGVLIGEQESATDNMRDDELNSPERVVESREYLEMVKGTADAVRQGITSEKDTSMHLSGEEIRALFELECEGYDLDRDSDQTLLVEGHWGGQTKTWRITLNEDGELDDEREFGVSKSIREIAETPAGGKEIVDVVAGEPRDNGGDF